MIHSLSSYIKISRKPSCSTCTGLVTNHINACLLPILYWKTAQMNILNSRRTAASLADPSLLSMTRTTDYEHELQNFLLYNTADISMLFFWQDWLHSLPSNEEGSTFSFVKMDKSSGKFRGRSWVMRNSKRLTFHLLTCWWMQMSKSRRMTCTNLSFFPRIKFS